MSIRVPAVVAVLLLAPGVGFAQAPDSAFGFVPDSLFTGAPGQPMYYRSSYDRNRSRGTWTQSLAYSLRRDRIVFSTNASVTRLSGLEGIRTDGDIGAINGTLDWRATPRWVWSLGGRFNGASTLDPLTVTDRRENRLEVRTQYSVGPWHDVTLVGSLSTEFQRDHKLANRTLTRFTGGAASTVTERDSAFTSGRRDGINVSLAWKPSPALEVQAAAVNSGVRTRQRILLRNFEAGISEVGRDTVIEEPSDNAVYSNRIVAEGPLGIRAIVNLQKQESDQTYFATDLRDAERVSFDSRSASIQLQQSPIRGGVMTLDASVTRSMREFLLDARQNALITGANLSATIAHTTAGQLASVNFIVDRSRTGRQQVQNGETINRHLGGRIQRRVTRRFTLEAGGSVGLLSRVYEVTPTNAGPDLGVSQADQDDARSSLTVGGGYHVSDRCTTTVHFSMNRTHSVAVHPSASGNNSVQTAYQMDAEMQLRLSTRFSIRQYYLLNASYRIHDDVSNEPRNTLSRNQRVETTVMDSLFAFATLGLTHNFYFQDYGSFVRSDPELERLFDVTSQQNVQSLGASLRVRPATGFNLGVTQTMVNERFRDLIGDSRIFRRRWNLTLSGDVDRTLPGALGLRGAVQRISEFTEPIEGSGRIEPVDYWQAGVTLEKSF